MTKSVKILRDDYIIVRGSSAFGLTSRGRIMQSPIDQIVQFSPPNKFYNLLLAHISGPLKGTTIKFSLAPARRAKFHNVCTCSGYNYPHTKGSKRCLSSTKR